MLRYDKAEDMLYYGSEIVCEVGYAGPVLDLLIDTFNELVKEYTYCHVDSITYIPYWRNKMEQLAVIASGRAEIR